MCLDCYLGYGAPKITTEKVRRAARLIGEVYTWHRTGGNLHTVIDDWSLEGDILDACRVQIIENPHHYPQMQIATEMRCLVALCSLNMDERISALAIHDGFLKP